MRHTQAGIVGAALLLSIALGACGSSEEATSSTAAPTTSAQNAAKSASVAFVTYALTDYVQTEAAGVKQAVEPTGGSVTTFSSDFDPQKQNQQCQDAITSGRYNAIVLVPVDPATGQPCVVAAHAAGIPVATMEQAVGPDPYTLKPQLDGVVAVASIPVQSMIDQLSQIVDDACANADPCKVIAEVATPTNKFTNDMVDGVAKALPKVDIVQKVVGQYDPSVIQKAIPDALTAHPDANVFLSAADSQAIASFPAIKQAGKWGSLKVIGNGGSRAGAKAVADGSLFGTVGAWPKQTGELIGQDLVDAVNGKPVRRPSINYLEVDSPVLVTKGTVAQFKPEWGAN